jgi:hypothetical protein
LQQSELQGVEASPEIQLAARRVVDENRRLRTLLAQHGVADRVVERCLQEMNTMDLFDGNRGLGQSGDVQVLEQSPI